MNISYAVGLLISAITSATIALIAWKRRSAPGASGLMLSMFADLIWAGTYAVRWMMVESSAQLFWLDATYFGVAFNSTFLLIFTLQFTGRFHLLTRRNLGLLASRAGALDQALACYARAAELAPNNPDHGLNLVAVLLKRNAPGDRQRAIAALRHTLEIVPNHPVARPLLDELLAPP